MAKTDKLRVKEYEQYILENVEKLSAKQMFKNLDISSCSGFSIMKRLQLETKPNRHFVTFGFNENYFEIIDTKEKAYFLGLIFADGNIHTTCKGRKRFQISLNKEDCYVIKKLTQAMDYPGKLHEDRGTLKFIIHNSKIFDDLLRLGCVERKSLIVSFPETLLPSLVSHFVRGYFDGNGSIYTKNRKNLSGIIGFAGSKQMMLDLKKIFESLCFKTSAFYPRYKEMENSAGSIAIYFTKEKNIDFYHWLYKDCQDLFLTRKKEKFENIINN